MRIFQLVLNIYEATFASQTNPQRGDGKLCILISHAFSSRIVPRTLRKVTAREMRSFAKGSALSLEQQRRSLLCLLLCCCYGISTHTSLQERKSHGDQITKGWISTAQCPSRLLTCLTPPFTKPAFTECKATASRPRALEKDRSSLALMRYALEILHCHHACSSALQKWFCLTPSAVSLRDVSFHRMPAFKSQVNQTQTNFPGCSKGPDERLASAPS